MQLEASISTVTGCATASLELDDRGRDGCSTRALPGLAHTRSRASRNSTDCSFPRATRLRTVAPTRGSELEHAAHLGPDAPTWCRSPPRARVTRRSIVKPPRRRSGCRQAPSHRGGDLHSSLDQSASAVRGGARSPRGSRPSRTRPSRRRRTAFPPAGGSPLGEPPELVQLLVRPQPQLEPRRPKPQPMEGSDAGHPSSLRGWPSAESSTMSRRKKSDTVQSVTTRILRRTVGSAKRW